MTDNVHFKRLRWALAQLLTKVAGVEYKYLDGFGPDTDPAQEPTKPKVKLEDVVVGRELELGEIEDTEHVRGYHDNLRDVAEHYTSLNAILREVTKCDFLVKDSAIHPRVYGPLKDFFKVRRVIFMSSISGTDITA